MRSKSMCLRAEDIPGCPEQSHPTYTAEGTRLMPFGIYPTSEAASVRSRSFMNRPDLGGNQAALLDYPVRMFPRTFLPLANQGDRYAQTAFAGQAFASSSMRADPSTGGYDAFGSGSTEPHQAPSVLGASLRLPAYRQNSFQGTRTRDNNLQAPPTRVRLRGGADSPARDNNEQPMTNGDHTASEPDDDADSLYRVDFTPRDLNGELGEVLGDRTRANGAVYGALGPEHPQRGVPVNGDYAPVNGLHAPANSPHAPVNDIYPPINGLHTRVPYQPSSSTQGYPPINGLHTRVPYVPYQASSSTQVDTQNLAGTHVNANPPASSSRRNSAANATHSRFDSMTDAQREELDRWVEDWWLCEPLGRVPSGASYSSSVDSFIAATYCGPDAPRDWREDYNYDAQWREDINYDAEWNEFHSNVWRDNDDYNATAGFEMQEQNVGYDLFPHQQNGTFSQVPGQQQEPSGTYSQQTAPEVPNMIPTNPDVHMSDLGAAPAQPATTITAGEHRSNTRTRGIFERLRETRNNARRMGSRLGHGIFRGRGGFRGSGGFRRR